MCEVCVIHQVGDFGERLREIGVRIHELKMRNRYSPSIIFRLYRLIKQRGYQVIHVHLFPGLYWGACLAWMFPGCRWVYTEHSMWNKRRELSWARWLEGWAYRQYDRIIAISESTAQSLFSWQPWLKDRISVIPNGIDLSMFDIPDALINRKRVELGVNDGTKIILYAGRLVKEKGADVLIRAVDFLKASEEGMDWRLFIAGDGPERDDLAGLCSTLNLGDRVQFLGNRSDVPELMAASDLVVLPSRWEGLPLSLLEAMAAGKPVVACQVGGVSEVIRDGKEGFLVPPEAPEAFKIAIQKLLNNPGLMSSLGQAGKQRAEFYSSETVTNQVRSLYIMLL